MKSKQSSRLVAVSFISICAFVGCGGSSGGDASDPSLQQIKSTVRQIIIPAQKNLTVTAEDLRESVQSFCAAPTAPELQNVRIAWQSTRYAWNDTEAFLSYGPAATLQAVAPMDSWPVNESAVNDVLSNSDPLDAGVLAGKTASVRGLPVIEYLLYPVAKSDAAAAQLFASEPRRCVYLQAASDDVAELALQLDTGWQARDGFANELEKAGAGSTQFPAAQDAVAAMFTGIVRAMGRLESKKITRPLGSSAESARPREVEAAFSQSSMEHWRRSFAGISATYFCDQSGSERQPAIADLVQTQSASIDADIRVQFQQINDSAKAITGSLEEAVVSQRDAVSKLQADLRVMQSLLEQDAAAVLGITIYPELTRVAIR